MHLPKVKHIALSEDPVVALKEIGDFIDSNLVLKGHRYPDGADKKRFKGYWQPIKFFYALMEIAHESKKYGKSSST